MNKQIYDEVLKIEAEGLRDVELLALVTDTSYEVIFYANHNGKVCQSNNLAESGVLSLDFVEKIYSDIADKIRADEKFDPAKMNIIKASGENITVEYDEKNCRVYGLKKEWKNSIGL